MIRRRAEAAGTASEAVYSDCLAYRYELTRTWEAAGPRGLYVLLNPSTADETRNDPTVERCERRARALGYGSFRVCNIFAFRATDPAELRRAAHPVGPGNDAAIGRAIDWADTILCGWGVHGAHLGRGPEVAARLRAAGAALTHLGLTQDGHPRHPLYIGYATRPSPWTPASCAQDIGPEPISC